MDGTTLNSAKKIPAATTAAIDELARRGIYVVVGTGRGICELSDYKNELKSVHYGILVSGALVYHFPEKKPIAVRALKLDDVLELISAAKEENAMLQVMGVRDSVVSEYDIMHMDEFCMGVYQEMYERVATRTDDIEGYVKEHDGEITKINVYHRSVESRDRSYNRIKGLDVSIVFAEKTGWEVSPAGINKGEGLKALCAHLGIDPAETVAIGDAENDIGILQTAGLAVAMGNAIDSVKKVCDIVVSDNDHDGVLEAIKKFF